MPHHNNHGQNESDSTFNNYDFINYGATIDTDGKIGNCYNLERNDSEYITQDTLLDTFSHYEITIEAWVNTETIGANGCIISKFQSGTDYINLQLRHNNTIFFWGGDEIDWYHYSTETIESNEWYYIVALGEAWEQTSIWINNTSHTGGDNFLKPDETGGPDLCIGRYGWSALHYWDGKLDEIRISKIKRSDTWIKTCYSNMNDPSSFMTINTEELQ